MGSTNQNDIFIALAPDCPANEAEIPAKPESVAGLQYAMLHDQPYRLTSDDLLFAIYARRNAAWMPLRSPNPERPSSPDPRPAYALRRSRSDTDGASTTTRTAAINCARLWRVCRPADPEAARGIRVASPEDL